jgi:Fe2+ transport system protein B
MSEFRSGFVSFVGRPNVGKSILLSQICIALTPTVFGIGFPLQKGMVMSLYILQ